MVNRFPATMTELTTLLHLQRSIRRFCRYSLREVNCYYANIASPSSPHDVLSLNVLISTVDPEPLLARGTAIFASGKLYSGTQGAMLDFDVTEYTRIDRVLAHIPTRATFVVEGVIESLHYLGEAHLIVRSSAGKCRSCYFLYVGEHDPIP